MSIRTVLADIPAEALGTTDYHEHLFQVSPLLAGDELVDEEVSRREAAALRSAGIAAMIDATPIALGRRPQSLARISEWTGLVVVATTGCHRSAHYQQQQWLTALDEAALATIMRIDIVDGMPEQDGPASAQAGESTQRVVRAGMLKVGIGYWDIDAFARRVLSAVGSVHRETNAPVMVHLESGSAAFEVLDLLREEGVPSEAVVLAHADRNPDPGLHAELAAAGAYLGYDGPARHREHPDCVLVDCAVRCVELGAGDRLLVGGDVARATRFAAAGGLPGMAYLPRRFIPRLRQALGEEATDRILVDNPRRLLDRFADGEIDRGSAG